MPELSKENPVKLMTTGRYAKGTNTLIGHKLTPLGIVNCRYVMDDSLLYSYVMVEAHITHPSGMGYKGFVVGHKPRKSGFSLSGERIRICMGCYGHNRDSGQT